MNSRILFLYVATAIAPYSLSAYAPDHFFRPYEIKTSLLEKNTHDFGTGLAAEWGSSSHAGNPEGQLCSIFQRYNEDESTVAMLKSRVTKNDEATALYNSLTPATLTENDGALVFEGTYERLQMTTWFSYKLPIEKTYGAFSVTAYLPFTYQRLKDITYAEKTPIDTTGSSAAVKTNITNDLTTFVKTYGNDLELPAGSHGYGGLADLALMLQWHKNFPQIRDYLQNVLIHADLGTTIPTGIKKNCNQPFLLENGNNGAWGIVLRSGIDLGFVHDFHCGLDVQFLGLFFVTDTFRLKTDPSQTSFLIPEKGIATLAQGNSWQFNLFGRWDKVFKSNFYGGFQYQFLTHNEDELYPLDNDFDFNVVNSSLALDEWSAHYFMFAFGYSNAHDKDARVTCDASLFYKAPMIYKKSIHMHTVGGSLIFRF